MSQTATIEPDDGSSAATWPKWQGAGAAALWQELCGATSDAPVDAERLPARYAARRVFCPLANASNIDKILGATKRTVPKPLLEYATALPWKW